MVEQIIMTHAYVDKQKRSSLYKKIPPPRKNAPPSEPGIYFIWDKEEIVYVGQSINLFQRLTNHPRKKPWFKVSCVAYEKAMLNFAECYYIGICKPRLNFSSCT